VIHKARLRQVSCWTKAQGRVHKCHVRQSILQVAGYGLKRIQAATEHNSEPTEAKARFVDHARREVVGPTGQNGLVKVRNVDKPAGSSVVVAVEVVVAIEQIAGGEAVSTQGNVIPDHKVEDMAGDRHNTGDSADFNQGMSGCAIAGTNWNQLSIPRRRATEAEGVRSVGG